ncbi:MAG: tryptophan--tRNA ligase [Alphaproteobacteria bacterium]|nr:tryptophan--tRNA ligase [Alphaproteobacteria bacterium]
MNLQNPYKSVVLTGDRPTGPLHLGHYIGSLKNRLDLQNSPQSHDMYIMVADTQALTDHFEHPTLVRQYTLELVKDYLAIGIDPEKTTLFIQSQVPELCELTAYFMNLVTVSRLERNPTVKAEIQQKGMQESLPAGFLCYPVSQAADITAFGRLESGTILVPVGEDQLPMIEITNEIVRRFNRLYGPCLQEAKGVLSPTARLMGIDGQHKAGKSLNNAIYLKDSKEVLREKVFQMYTDPGHIHVQDPGKVDGNMIFHYLDAFAPDQEQVRAFKAHYEKGGLGDVVLKKYLFSVLETLLGPIWEKRQTVRDQDAMEVLMHGSKQARQRVQEKMSHVRAAMQLDY